jgi:hypothetical protein
MLVHERNYMNIKGKLCCYLQNHINISMPFKRPQSKLQIKRKNSEIFFNHTQYHVTTLFLYFLTFS